MTWHSPKGQHGCRQESQLGVAVGRLIKFHDVGFNVAISHISFHLFLVTIFQVTQSNSVCVSVCVLLSPLQKVVYIVRWPQGSPNSMQMLHRRMFVSVVAIWQNSSELQAVPDRATVNFAIHWASLRDLSQRCNILCYLVGFLNINFLSVSFWVCRCN